MSSRNTNSVGIQYGSLELGTVEREEGRGQARAKTIACFFQRNKKKILDALAKNPSVHLSNNCIIVSPYIREGFLFASP